MLSGQHGGRIHCPKVHFSSSKMPNVARTKPIIGISDIHVMIIRRYIIKEKNLTILTVSNGREKKLYIPFFSL